MSIVYSPSARDDLTWMRTYYSRVFPDGAVNARRHLKAAEKNLCANPEIGRPSEVATLRELPIARTPFSIVYAIRHNRILILRVWDGRAERSDMRLS